MVKNNHQDEQKDNIMIGIGLGNNIKSVNNIIIGNDMLNHRELKDVFAVGSEEKMLIAGDLSSSILKVKPNSFAKVESLGPPGAPTAIHSLFSLIATACPNFSPCANTGDTIFSLVAYNWSTFLVTTYTVP